jgi:hypothetical protein
MNGNEGSDLRELAAGELDEVSGGMWGFLAVCAAVGIAAMAAIASTADRAPNGAGQLEKWLSETPPIL